MTWGRGLVAACVAVGIAAACGRRGEATAPALPAPSPRATVAAASTSASPPPVAPAASIPMPADAGADAAPSHPGRTEGCPDGMLRVEGEYCLLAVQTCLEEVPAAPPNVAPRCLRYQQPSTCYADRRKHLAFCMDRFEYPNREGELPRVLTDFRQASALCEKEGKRICTVDEFNFACEGPEMLPYAYGYVRDATKCNIDKPYRSPDYSFMMSYWDDCPKDERCQKELARLDQRMKIGESLSCVSWAGVYDLNGNVNEWVRRPDKSTYPDRGGLKGGWWGPVRDRCRPTHTTHNEDYWGYEVGFRCCKDVPR